MPTSALQNVAISHRISIKPDNSGGRTGSSAPTVQNGKPLRFARSFVGADAYIGPSKYCDFASDLRKNGYFRRADRVVRPYDAKSKPNAITSDRPYGAKGEINTDSPEKHHKTGSFGGSMWASTPTTQNRKCGGFSPDARGFSYPYDAKSKPCTTMPIRPYGAESPFRGFANRQPIRTERVRQGPDALFCVIF